MQSNRNSAAVPANLLEALKKIEMSGNIPLLIPTQLEIFLTEQGLYQSSMTPSDAWQALQVFAGLTPPEPETEEGPAKAQLEATGEPLAEPAPTAEAETKPISRPVSRILKQRKHRT